MRVLKKTNHAIASMISDAVVLSLSKEEVRLLWRALDLFEQAQLGPSKGDRLLSKMLDTIDDLMGRLKAREGEVRWDWEQQDS